MSIPTAEFFESFVPVYDAIPEKWDDARIYLVEQLKGLSNAVNIREIGWFLDEEQLSGKQFFPSATSPQRVFRSVFRKVVDCSPLVAGVNAPILHGILFDASFSLISLWVAGTNSATLTARVINGNDVLMTATTLNITSPQAFDRAYATIEFIIEV